MTRTEPALEPPTRSRTRRVLAWTFPKPAGDGQWVWTYVCAAYVAAVVAWAV